MRRDRVPNRGQDALRVVLFPGGDGDDAVQFVRNDDELTPHTVGTVGLGARDAAPELIAVAVLVVGAVLVRRGVGERLPAFVDLFGADEAFSLVDAAV